MANIYSVEAAKSTAAPSVRTLNTKNGAVHYYEDYVVTTSAISATGDTITFRAGAIPNGARICGDQIAIYSGAFGTDVDFNLGDSASATRFAASADVAAATALLGGATLGVTLAANGAAKATGAAGSDFTVTSENYTLVGTFKTSAPATGIGLAIRVPYVF